jgi:hypothetical protein
LLLKQFKFSIWNNLAFKYSIKSEALFATKSDWFRPSIPAFEVNMLKVVLDEFVLDRGAVVIDALDDIFPPSFGESECLNKKGWVELHQGYYGVRIGA